MARETPAIAYNAALGHAYDESRQLHVYGFRENVPFWWGLKKASPFRRGTIIALILGASGGLLIGQLLLNAAAHLGALFYFFRSIMWGFIIAGAVGGISIYLRVLTKPLPKLTCASGAGGTVSNLAAIIEIDPAGDAKLFREWLSADPATGRDYAPVAFPIWTAKSIERRSLAEEEPDVFAKTDPSRYRSGAAKRIATERRDEAREAELLILVFDDGQTLDVGWQTSRNEAARLQADLIRLFGELRTLLSDRQRKAETAALIGPNDEAL